MRERRDAMWRLTIALAFCILIVGNIGGMALEETIQSESEQHEDCSAVNKHIAQHCSDPANSEAHCAFLSKMAAKCKARLLMGNSLLKSSSEGSATELLQESREGCDHSCFRLGFDHGKKKCEKKNQKKKQAKEECEK